MKVTLLFFIAFNLQCISSMRGLGGEYMNINSGGPVTIIGTL